MMRVGRGIADITGEPADCGMLGYGKAEQRTTGIHLRLRARAFVFEAEPNRVLLVVAELPLPMQSVTDEVLARLRRSLAGRYTESNTLITVTHTHSGPGGYCGHLLYNMTTGGFRPATFEAIVGGIVAAVEQADADLAPAQVSLARGELHDASTNRSPSAFARNPAADRAVFPDGIDPQTSLLRIDRDGAPVGAINFFATHGTSMTNHNTLISSDNKGYAAYHWERLVQAQDYLAGPLDFIAAFAQTNTADMSPNVGGRLGMGPTEDEVENTRIIGLRQYEAAAGLPGGTPIGDTVEARMIRVDLGDVQVRGEFTPDGKPHRTGRPMVAAAALAGTDEGEGFPGFHQGRNLLFDTVSAGVYRLNRRLRDAHAPKGLIAPGSLLNRLRPFMQERVPVQLLRIGRLYLIGIPGEVTIVAGLRLRRVVAGIVGADLADVLCVGYSNAYIHYVTTPEEYTEQRYEGGSTLFGRWELPALMQTAAGLATAMGDGVPAGPSAPPAATTRASWLRKPRPDTGEFGAVVTQPQTEYLPGQQVRAEFVSANPNNDLHNGGTYLEVQRRDENTWVRIADDGDWTTRFRWRRTGRGGSLAGVEWVIPADASPGRYRILHHGTARGAGGNDTSFSGATHAFTVGGPR
ncbi:neutral/alkaline ceramidase [Mycobacterium sp. M1]|uniref:Neutral ceramidase n=1 Tax=Mycolicibacter acidiphilus TaxID=2835306 RepID=A0ABS5RDX0_9MYCO|nr:neutral/alkaline non-lysosomal ceramidase N-terminal domain-containing protein [Mycolicibacter acidiphilus]MBS9532487.1 neutral/alkaline ceramidase [Mycolicibacter acidiphilus]